MDILATFLILLACRFAVGKDFEVPTMADYRRYLVQHKKSLERLQDPRRFEAYQRSAAFVADHKSESYQVGLNELADWLPHEVPGVASAASSITSTIRNPWNSPPYSAADSKVKGNTPSTMSSFRGVTDKMRRAMNRNEQDDHHHDEGLSRDKIIVATSGKDKKTVKDAKRYLSAKTWEGSLLGLFGYGGTNDDANGGNDRSGGSQGINWASHNNPYNVSIVGEVANQGACGACWSFVAASAVEASVYMSSKIHLRLSTQELVDCDRTFNRGCEGGNPIYAFEYIMRHGLTNQHSYPYDEHQHAMCRRAQYVSRATIKSYLRLPPNNIELIKQFLHLGPIATGICGTNSSFLYYTGGLYDPPKCCQTQNHAVLIVGYGVDQATQREYLVLMNSWGEYWGEKGFMRIAAYPPSSPDSSSGPDSSSSSYSTDPAIIPEAGTCGVAVGPSLPTDGVLIPLYSRQGSSTDGNNSGSHDDEDKHRPVVMDDDSYTDDGTATPGDDDTNASPSWFWRAENRLYFWYQLNKTNYLFFFAVFLFVCSCGLCLYTLYEDCCGERALDTGSGRVTDLTGLEIGDADSDDTREFLNRTGGSGRGFNTRRTPKSPRSVRHVNKIK